MTDLNTRIAEAKGWGTYWSSDGEVLLVRKPEHENVSDLERCPDWQGDIAAAWTLVEEMADDWKESLKEDFNPIRFSRHMRFFEELRNAIADQGEDIAAEWASDTMLPYYLNPEAICRAWLAVQEGAKGDE